MKTGVELSFGFTGTYSATTGWQNTKEETFAIEQKVIIPPGEGLVNQVSYTTLQVTEIPCSGRLVSYYDNGLQLESPIGGKFTGSTASKLDAVYATRPITKTP
jgi:hypothetical protein